MGQINTVTGPIDSSQLGFTLMHEHVMVSASGLYDRCFKRRYPFWIVFWKQKLSKRR